MGSRGVQGSESLEVRQEGMTPEVVLAQRLAIAVRNLLMGFGDDGVGVEYKFESDERTATAKCHLRRIGPFSSVRFKMEFDIRRST